MKARLVALFALGALVATLATPASAAACADPKADLGEWRSYSGNLEGTRTQTASPAINPASAANLTLAWVFETNVAQSGGGTFSNTPIVADGCVFLASNTGFAYALNADSGELVWKSEKLPGNGQTLLGGVIVGSPVVAEGKVYVGVSQPGQPYVAALDETTGALLWTTAVTGFDAATKQNNALINASPVYYDGMIFQGFAGNEGGSVARGGFAIVDASTGERLVHTYTINDAEYAAGYRGASVWCTAAIDAATGYAYACGGNPASKRIEHRYSNAMLKIDVNPARATFGQIVDSYKGDNDQYYPGLDRQPACDALGDTLVAVWSLACLQLDLDFGASPALTTDALGNTIVGNLQKSGIYHALYADHMDRAWTTVVGGPCAACNAGSAAVDGTNVYVVGTPGGVLSSLTRNNGRYRWAQPIGDGTHFQSTSSANGVAFTVDGGGTLRAFDGESGVPLFVRPLTIDTTGSAVDGSSQGVAIARNLVYVTSGPYTFAYKV